MSTREIALGEETVRLIRRVESVFGGDDFVLPTDIGVGDQIIIPLGELGIFTATAQKVTDGKPLFIFDGCITERPMNKNNHNKGGYDESDLRNWIENDLIKMFPTVLRNHISGLSIPTLGEICGWDDTWSRECIEVDVDKQLPLMKQRLNRIAYYKGDRVWWWLRNAAKKEVSSSDFAFVSNYGAAFYYGASDSYGVRPEFWLVK